MGLYITIRYQTSSILEKIAIGGKGCNNTYEKFQLCFNMRLLKKFDKNGKNNDYMITEFSDHN